MIEWGIGFLVGGLIVGFLPMISNMILLFTNMSVESLQFILITAILCGIALIVIGARSREKPR